MTFITIVAYGLVLSVVLSALFVRYGNSWGVLSRRDFRRKNPEAVPQLGGLAIFITIFAVSFFVQNRLPITWPILISSLPIFIAGFIDDRFEISARYKFAAQILSTTIFFSLWPAESFLLIKLGWSPAIAYALMGFWIVGIVNAMNMIDGMDGEAGLISLVALIAIFGLGPDVEGPLLAIAGGAVAGFMLFNKPPAKLYLGDSGSSALGFLLACHLVHYSPAGGAARWSDILVPLFVLAIPEIDALLAIGRRLKLGSSIFSGDHDHLHHKLLRLGMDVSVALSTIVCIGAFCATVGLVIVRLDPLEYRLLLVLASSILLLIVTRLIYFFEIRQGVLMSAYGRTIIEQNLVMRELAHFDERDFRATVYDLLPYYKELQKLGILAVQNFTQEFARYIETNHAPECGRRMVGSYSLVILESPKSMTVQQESHIAQMFFQLLARHSLQKNSGERPWGLEFYSDQYKSQTYLKSFRPLKRDDSALQSRKTA